MEQSRFHSPYRHMVSGLLIEAAFYAAFLVAMALLALAAAVLT